MGAIKRGFLWLLFTVGYALISFGLVGTVLCFLIGSYFIEVCIKGVILGIVLMVLKLVLDNTIHSVKDITKWRDDMKSKCISRRLDVGEYNMPAFSQVSTYLGSGSVSTSLGLTFNRSGLYLTMEDLVIIFDEGLQEDFNHKMKDGKFIGHGIDFQSIIAVNIVGNIESSFERTNYHTDTYNQKTVDNRRTQVIALYNYPDGEVREVTYTLPLYCYNSLIARINMARANNNNNSN